MAQIEVRHLIKQYDTIKREKGLRGLMKSLVNPEKTTVQAVEDISFNIDKAEILGYIGPNGAGKSTTIKMMTGMMTPTSGSVSIEGDSPQPSLRKNLKLLI